MKLKTFGLITLFSLLLLGGCEWLIKNLVYYSEVVITDPDDDNVAGTTSINISVDSNYTNIETLTLTYESGSFNYHNPYYKNTFDLDAYRASEDSSIAKPTDMDFSHTFYGVPLQEGANMISISGYDDFTFSWLNDEITVYRDRTGPVITINSPTNGTTITTPSVTFAGEVSDARSSMGAMLYQGSNGEFGNIEWAADGTWSFSLSNLQNGSQSFSIKAWDELENLTTETVSFTFSYP